MKRINKEAQLTHWFWLIALVFVTVCLAFLACTTPAKASTARGLIDIGDAQKSILYDTDLPQRIQIYRIYNPNTGEHFYTKDEGEKNEDVAAGWVDEGIGWWISPYVSKNPVYRLYNSYVGDHHYTPSAIERDMLKDAGWTDEGNTWYETEEGDADRIPVYRTYNPYEYSWNHFYTKSEKEYGDLVDAGWNDEKVAWYAYDKLQTNISDANVTLGATLTYNGSEQTQTVTVKIGSKTLTAGTDYTLEGATNKDAGTYTLTITGNSDAGYVGTITRTYTIAKKTIDIQSISVNDKEYDQTTEATLAGIEFTGVCGEEDVSLNFAIAFEDAAVGNDKTINVSDVELVGADIANYELSQSGVPQVKASITQKKLRVTGLSFENKTYDRTNTATATGSGAVLDPGLPGEDVSLEDINARFEDKNAGENKKVLVDDFKLIGADAANYVVVSDQESYTATIYPKPVTIESLSFKERVYEEGNTDAEIDTSTNQFNSDAIIEGDEVVVAEATYSYADDNAGNDKQVTLSEAPALAGREKDNYQVVSYPKPMEGTVLAIVKYNTNCVDTDKEDEHVKIGSTLTRDEADMERSGLKIENWYTDSRCSDDDEHRWDFASDTVTENVTTLTANWVPDGDSNRYWISPSMNIASGSKEQGKIEGNENYVKEEWNVKKSAAEIKEDLDILKNSNPNYDEYKAVYAEYEGFLSNDDYHLYTKFTGENKSTYGDEADSTGLNSYIEARVIQVGQHDGDGTGLTFQTTHLLPQAMSMNDSKTNVDGWNKSSPLKVMNTAPTTINFTYVYIDPVTKDYSANCSGTYSSLKDCVNLAFWTDIKSISKKYNQGNKSSRNGAASVSSKMWLLSYTEIDADHDEQGTTPYPAQGVEGTTYQWFTNHKVNMCYGNSILEQKTRNGKIPRNYFYNDENYVYWWLRSPRTDVAEKFLYSNDYGHSGTYGAANNSMGITVGFAM